MKTNKTKGFSIIELIVVMAILAVLMLIAIPTFTDFLEDAKKTSQNGTANALYKATSATLVDDFVSTSPTTFADTDLTADGLDADHDFVTAVDGRMQSNSGVTFVIKPYNSSTAPTAPTTADAVNWTIFIPVKQPISAGSYYVDAESDIVLYAPITNDEYVNGYLVD